MRKKYKLDSPFVRPQDGKACAIAYSFLAAPTSISPLVHFCYLWKVEV